MKRFVLIFSLIAGSWAQSIAQGPPPGDKRAEMLESLRVAFISRQLELTPEEAEKFWPVYNQYQGDLRKMASEHRGKGGTELEFEEKLLNLRKQYQGPITKTISDQKFDRLMKAEKSWGEMLRKEIQRRREMGERPGGPNGPRGGRPIQ